MACAFRYCFDVRQSVRAMAVNINCMPSKPLCRLAAVSSSAKFVIIYKTILPGLFYCRSAGITLCREAVVRLRLSEHRPIWAVSSKISSSLLSALMSLVPWPTQRTHWSPLTALIALCTAWNLPCWSQNTQYFSIVFADINIVNSKPSDGILTFWFACWTSEFS